MTTNQAENAQQNAGASVLWIGVECANWSIPQFVAAAQAAKALGFDTISPKRADGSIRWYHTPQQLAAERAAVLAEGVGYLPFAYCYGPHFGLQQVHDECAVLAEMCAANDGSVLADLEAEWNGQVESATLFAQLMQPVSGLLYLTTWADPNLQDWDGVLAALAPVSTHGFPRGIPTFSRTSHSLKRRSFPVSI